MNRKLAVFAAIATASVFACQSADAGSRKLDRRVKATAIGVGLASTAAFFGINGWKTGTWTAGVSRAGAWAGTTIGCAAVSPIVATVAVKRELTMREAHYLAGSCVVPVIGGWLVNRAYDANPHWEGKTRKRR